MALFYLVRAANASKANATLSRPVRLKIGVLKRSEQMKFKDLF